jgi:hypothetical protein
MGGFGAALFACAGLQRRDLLHQIGKVLPSGCLLQYELLPGNDSCCPNGDCCHQKK